MFNRPSEGHGHFAMAPQFGFGQMMQHGQRNPDSHMMQDAHFNERMMMSNSMMPSNDMMGSNMMNNQMMNSMPSNDMMNMMNNSMMPSNDMMGSNMMNSPIMNTSMMNKTSVQRMLKGNPIKKDFPERSAPEREFVVTAPVKKTPQKIERPKNNKSGKHLGKRRPLIHNPIDNTEYDFDRWNVHIQNTVRPLVSYIKINNHQLLADLWKSLVVEDLLAIFEKSRGFALALVECMFRESELFPATHANVIVDAINHHDSHDFLTSLLKEKAISCGAQEKLRVIDCMILKCTNVFQFGVIKAIFDKNRDYFYPGEMYRGRISEHYINGKSPIYTFIDCYVSLANRNAVTKIHVVMRQLFVVHDWVPHNSGDGNLFKMNGPESERLLSEALDILDRSTNGPSLSPPRSPERTHFIDTYGQDTSHEELKKREEEKKREEQMKRDAERKAALNRISCEIEETERRRNEASQKVAELKKEWNKLTDYITDCDKQVRGSPA